MSERSRGLTHSSARGSLFLLRQRGDLPLHELDPSSTSLVQTEVSVSPPGRFTPLYGDLDVLRVLGDYLVSLPAVQLSDKEPEVIRLAATDGTPIGDISLEHVSNDGRFALSRIAVDDDTGEIWISTGRSVVIRLPEPELSVALWVSILGFAWWGRWNRVRQHPTNPRVGFQLSRRFGLRGQSRAIDCRCVSEHSGA